jgi:hypothetical protein
MPRSPTRWDRGKSGALVSGPRPPRVGLLQGNVGAQAGPTRANLRRDPIRSLRYAPRWDGHRPTHIVTTATKKGAPGGGTSLRAGPNGLDPRRKERVDVPGLARRVWAVGIRGDSWRATTSQTEFRRPTMSTPEPKMVRASRMTITRRNGNDHEALAVDAPPKAGHRQHRLPAACSSPYRVRPAG